MAEEAQKKIILSGIQPTGVFTLGNYLGAVKGWKDLQEEYNCYYFIADLHSMTIHIDPHPRRGRADRGRDAAAAHGSAAPHRVPRTVSRRRL